MSVQTAVPIEFSDAAARKVKALVDEEENPNLKLRVYILMILQFHVIYLRSPTVFLLWILSFW